MSKYIIEIEDVPFSRVHIDADNGAQNINLYRAKGFNSLVFDQFGLDKLTPLDKALSSELGESYHKGFEAGQHEATTLEYQQGLDDAWEAARTIVWNTSFDDWISVGVDIGDWDGDECEALNRYSVSEAIEILKKMGKPNHDEIKVGDEATIYGINGNVVVVEVDGDCVDLSDLRGWHSWYDSKNVKKTGRHFPQVAELLKAMKEGAE